MLVRFFHMYVDPTVIGWVETTYRFQDNDRIYTIKAYTKEGIPLPVQTAAVSIKDQDAVERVNKLSDQSFLNIGMNGDDVTYYPET